MATCGGELAARTIDEIFNTISVYALPVIRNRYDEGHHPGRLDKVQEGMTARELSNHTINTYFVYLVYSHMVDDMTPKAPLTIQPLTVDAAVDNSKTFDEDVRRPRKRGAAKNCSPPVIFGRGERI